MFTRRIPVYSRYINVFYPTLPHFTSFYTPFYSKERGSVSRITAYYTAYYSLTLSSFPPK